MTNLPPCHLELRNAQLLGPLPSLLREPRHIYIAHSPGTLTSLFEDTGVTLSYVEQ